MAIDKIIAYSAQVTQRPQEPSQRTATDDKVSGKEALGESDRVKWSTGYQEMAQVKKVMMERGDIRTERVDHFRNLIENNAYTVDPDKVAKKMLEELW